MTSSISDESIKNAIGTVRQRKGRAPVSPEEKARREKVALEEKAKRAQDREAAKAEKKRLAETNRGPVHMKKVQRAAERLPSISDAAKDAVQTLLTGAFDRSEITGIIAHVTHSLRADATVKAQSVTIEVGNMVRINDVSSRYFNQLGRVVAARRLRCYVEPLTAPGQKVYLFNSDVEKVDNDNGIEALTTIDEPLSQVG